MRKDVAIALDVVTGPAIRLAVSRAAFAPGQRSRERLA
jgi:hypothetical protein